MSELSLPAKTLWQAPVGWLGATILCGLGLWLIYQQTPAIYRRPLRNIRWFVIPYLGLLTGGISPRFMGLTGINWFASFGFGLVLIAGILAVLALVRSVTAFSVAAAATAPAVAAPTLGRSLAGQQLGATERQKQYATAFSISVLNIGAEEFHLAFLRSALWELLLTFPITMTQAGYWSAWAALTLALPEALYYPATVTQRLCKGALLVATTVLFIFTRNFWLCWLLHLLGWILLAPSAHTKGQP
ncbi:MAG: hypothetical protein DYG89_46290 [Caldilinea sp. CFX5]|nr:hypothetical protein [Caldilinea sp. CFX5]